MIRVRIQLESAITGEITELGQMCIANPGRLQSKERGDYVVAVARKGTISPKGCMPVEPGIARRGEVLNYPRLSYNVWRLILRALKSAFPEEA